MTKTKIAGVTPMAQPDRPLRADPSSSPWQARWAEVGLYGPTSTTTTAEVLLLTMYPYPSGDLHIGHWYIKTPTDALARFHRMHGENVFLPIGFDAFGLPAENAAIKGGFHPREWTMLNIENMRRQLRSMGATFDWEAEVVTCDPAYYRWNQWLFLRFLEAGLAYRAMSPVDWCPNDGTLAREQVEGADRRCWRCGAKVEKRDLEQWYLRTTKYADELLDFSGIDWPEPVRIMQTNWIGRSEGARDRVPHRARRPPARRRRDPRLHDAAGHPVRSDVHGPGPRAPTRRQADRSRTAGRGRRLRRASPCRETEIERLSTEREKTGVAIGADAINPVNDERIPIFMADYVLAGYGTGAIMAVPAHDERDYEFAVGFGLPIRRVVAAPGDEGNALYGAYVAHSADERLVNSGRFSGMSADEGGRAIVAWLAESEAATSGRYLPVARLARKQAALLGYSDPGRLLRSLRDRAGAGQ